MTAERTPRVLAERAVKLASRDVGLLTSRWRMTPSLLIVGAQRCGTTSMYKDLTQHPAVLPAVMQKGIHYFDTGYEHHHRWYIAHFPLRRTAARLQKTIGVAPITGESSPYYMFHPLGAGRIAADLPDIRLLVLVRDPVERAYSGHTHETARRYETESFERALELEPERTAGEEEKLISDPGYQSFAHQHHSYLARGRYVEQLERLEAAVGRDRIHVVDSGRFFDEPEPVYDEIIDFLQLPAWRRPEFKQHNSRPRMDMSPELRTKLEEYFRPFDEKLTDWLGRPPSWLK
ncbi:MAG TPA: sulfotransferase domain-containing protein [Frankiaceae bacterium]|nr:sulfotransferase domain-containing protein [Frankiaceae bacterium]